MKRRVDIVDTVQRHCWQCMHALVGVTAHQTKIPYVAIITVNPRTEPTPSAICLRARWAIAKRHEVVERRAMARQQDLNEIYGAAAWLENTGRGIEWVFC